MSHGFSRDEAIAVVWALLFVLNAFNAFNERGWSRFMWGFFCVLCAVLTFAFGYSAFTQLVHR